MDYIPPANPLRHVSYSELSTYRQCPHKHYLSKIEAWQSEKISPALTRGKVFHQALAEHYSALKDPTPATLREEMKVSDEQRYIPVGDPDPIVNAQHVIEAVEDDETRDLLSWMYEGYTAVYGSDEEWTILEVEHISETPLPTEEGGRSVYALKMIADLLVRDERGRIWLVDHKTGADFPKELGLDLDDQFSLYSWGLRQRGIDVYGVIYNAIRTRRNKTPMALEDRFKRIPMYRTPEQLENTALDAYRTTRRMRSAQWAERTTNSDTCIWRCPYTEACLFGRKGGDEEEFLISAGFTRSREHR